VCLVCASPAAGATLLSSFVVLPWTSSTSAVCSVTDASAKKTIDVAVEMLDDDDGVKKSGVLTLPPLATRVLSDDTPGGFTTISCASRFTVPGGRTSVRAYGAIHDVTVGTLFLSEAR
jgi:hypothetical protein